MSVFSKLNPNFPSPNHRCPRRTLQRHPGVNLVVKYLMVALASIS
ncbi:hypothetical protein [Dethiosulfovibrio salsuginis]|nr:hypothetical protein [Dethiosulfovibrio salsuginis]